MNYGLIILYLFAFIGLLFAAHKHGKPRSNGSFWIVLLSVIIQFVLIWWALGWRFW